MMSVALIFAAVFVFIVLFFLSMPFLAQIPDVYWKYFDWVENRSKKWLN